MWLLLLGFGGLAYGLYRLVGESLVLFLLVCNLLLLLLVFLVVLCLKDSERHTPGPWRRSPDAA